ncbi:MAG: hypothetical protein ACI9IV_001849 [Paracoccaceae bacterium]|jgi:hypothetical protein
MINLFVLRLTSDVSLQVFQDDRFLNHWPVFRSVSAPFKGDIPVIGPMFLPSEHLCLRRVDQVGGARSIPCCKLFCGCARSESIRVLLALWGSIFAAPAKSTSL